MTRRSRRELERAVDDLDEPDIVGYAEMLRYLQGHLVKYGPAADPPEEFFANRPWGPWAKAVAGQDVRLPGIDPEELTPPELFALRYCDEDVRRAIVALRSSESTGSVVCP